MSNLVTRKAMLVCEGAFQNKDVHFEGCRLRIEAQPLSENIQRTVVKRGGQG